MRTISPEVPIMSAKAATGSGNVIDVSEYDTIVVAIHTASSANLTVKFQGSIAEAVPTWGSAQSPSNPWDYVQCKDLQDGSSVNGDTGFACAGTDDNRLFEINVNGLKWLNAICTARAAGSVTIIGRGFSAGHGE